VSVEPRSEFADFGLKLSDLGLKLLNLRLQQRHQLGELSTLGAAGGGCWHRVVHKPFIGRWFRKTPSSLEEREIVLAFLKAGE